MLRGRDWRLNITGVEFDRLGLRSGRMGARTMIQGMALPEVISSCCKVHLPVDALFFWRRRRMAEQIGPRQRDEGVLAGNDSGKDAVRGNEAHVDGTD